MDLLRSLLTEGVELGEFEEDLNVEELAICFTYLIEGGIMLSRLYEDNMYIRRNINWLLSEITRYRKLK